ncbi:LuxR family transcriptional regulator [Mesorhizobium sp. LSHC414A00]|uniref:LuxR family transcriptional regulator n=1 Tax=Mesorhizobium sp. LSHC414A00 TaxID=1287287 RepID=UPI0003CE0E20|nr:LuxR family transcriptional regulator [Mesorhizobium sp. LSHC414A00]ESX66332.1 transcriptional regulator [Mesorhizobium sp. LSHC414A00]
MQDVFHRFVEQIADSADATDLRNALGEIASSLDLPSFAYLFPSLGKGRKVRLISTYPQPWTSHYLHSQYEKIDPVIHQARGRQETFSWDAHASDLELTTLQRQLMDEATQFGIRCGFTIPIHDSGGLFAALTFASDERQPLFFRVIDRYERALELIAIFFHLHARRKLSDGRIVDGVVLSRREIECLKWAARGKTAWEIGRILGISQRTAAYHRDNARKKLGAPTTIQAAIRLALSRPSDVT